MSTEDKRPPRRRIAGERPAAGAGARPPRVVKRPVVRPPGVVPGEEPDSADPQGARPESTDTKSTVGAADAPVADPTPTPVEDPAGDDAAGDPVEEPSDGGRTDPRPEESAPTPARSASPPRIAAAGRRQRTASDSDPSSSDPPLGRAEAKSPGEDPASDAARGRTLATVGTVALAVLAVVLAGSAVVWASQQVRSTGTASAQAEAADAAAAAAETILGYRYDQLEQHLEESQALMTPEYGEDFESLSPALNDLAPQRQIVVEAAAREVAPLPCGDDCSSDRAEVLVFVDQARVVADDAEPTVFGNRISLTMVREGGTWLVDDIEAY